MTQKDKELLLKDLCGRLPYGIMIHTAVGIGHLNFINQTIFGVELGINVNPVERGNFDIIDCEPYLRPMSSMTEEEKDKYNETREYKYVDDDHYEYFDTLDTFDWLNEHHFDYRGLIEEKLAWEAPEGMYKN